MLFRSNKNNEIVVNIDENNYVQLCPNCSFPNEECSDECVACKYPFEDSDIIHVLAKNVIKCESCGSFMTIDDLKCNFCGITHFADNNFNEKNEKFIIICPNCATENEANSILCSNCGMSIEEEFPVLKENNYEDKTICIENSKNEIVFFDRTKAEPHTVSLNNGEEIKIGRNSIFSELLSDNKYVGREHFILSFHDNVFWIRDISTNGTYINGQRIEKYKEIKLENNSDIVLGANVENEQNAAYFIVSY